MFWAIGKDKKMHMADSPNLLRPKYVTQQPLVVCQALLKLAKEDGKLSSADLDHHVVEGFYSPKGLSLINPNLFGSWDFW